MLLSADTPERRALAADIAALLEEKDPLAGEGDVALDRRLDMLRRERRLGRLGRWARIAKIARQYAELLHSEEENTTVNPYEAGALLASAYPERIGKAWHEGVGVFQLSSGELVAVEPSDALAGAEMMVAASLHQKAGGVGRVFLASVVDVIDLSWLCRERDTVYWDSKAGMVVARRETRIGALLLASAPLAVEDRQTVQQVICNAIVKEGPSMLDFSDEVKSLQLRIAFVASRHPELSLPPVDRESICQSAPEWGPLFIG
jgi:ATP-dependent helicase HrpB